MQSRQCAVRILKPMPTLFRRLAAEAVGTAFLLAMIVGSGIMAERLSGGNVAIALLANTLATGAGLVVLINILGPISGAHFNPAVSLVMVVRLTMPLRVAFGYIGAQIIGAIVGVWVAHLMFDLPVLQVSHRLRDGSAQLFAECIATIGLIGTILGGLRFQADRVGLLVGLYIIAAYWFTASTSFSNPAVTIARALTDSFSGIAPESVPGFIIAQVLGALLASPLFGWLFHQDEMP